MKTRSLLRLCAALAAALATPLAALDNTFTYQGTLGDAGQPATGFYDFNFALLSATGTPLAAPLFFDNVEVTNGAFAVPLGFGYAFGSVDVELEIGVRAGTSTGAFTTMLPRQRIRPAPYAQHAERVASGAIGAAQIVNGSIGTVQIAGSAIDSARIQDGTIVAADIAANTITGAAVAAETITAANIAPNAVTSSELLNGAVSLGKISVAGSTAGQVLSTNGSTAAWSSPASRRFYLTKSIPDPTGNDADAVCAAGFHFASIWELADVGSLRYDTVLGNTNVDSGSGPPRAVGWVRTGAQESSSNFNCSAWTSGSGGSGATAALSADPAQQDVGPWIFGSFLCSFRVPSWCIED